ncbi:MAG: DUF3048 domain-containing protein [Clostridia bacterium]|nr:DUF3048 domain-containing protein [Clostridia bacterium]MDD4386324.1 DUF3048 domain-containing protein [Clostridia bacterium]
MKKRKITYILILLIVLSSVLVYIYYNRYVKTNKANSDLKYQEINKIEEVVKEVKEIKKLQVYTGYDRPIAVMIDNEKPAWPHSGLQDAYMIYEMIIEGGETRMVALFKNKSTAKIGPIRSARHYFIHYAMEHNAIFTHFGWSPKAQTTISSYNVNNINGIYDNYFWRVGGGYHNAFSSIENIKKTAISKNYIDYENDTPIYNYSIDEFTLEKGITISGLKIKYSDLHNVSYKYDETEKVFYRSMREILDKDRETGKQYYAKNIIIMYVKNYNLPDVETKGRQELENIGTGKGYYITNGKYIDITWKKESAKSKTLWLDIDNKEIVLNDGITYVQLAPSNYKVNFELIENVDSDIKN